MNPNLLSVQDKAWSIKDICDSLEPRKLSQADLATLDSIGRDLDRLQAKLVGIRDKRKRDKAEPAGNGVEQGELGIGGEHG